MRGRWGHVAVLAAIGSACLAGCSTGRAPVFHPAGVALSASSPPSVAGSGPAATYPPGVHRFPLPASLRVVFDSPLPSGKTAAAIVVADENYQLAFYSAMAAGPKDHSYARYTSPLPFGNTDSQLRWTEQDLAHYAKTHTTRLGTIVLSRIHITYRRGKGAVVRFCVNESKFKYLNTRTGKTQPPKHRYYLEDDSVDRQFGSTWVVTYSFDYFGKNKLAEGCRP
jgi:hypothetical protein